MNHQMFKNINPQQMVQRMLGNNPILNDLFKMAQNGDKKGVELFARNLFKENGRDFDKEFNEFLSNFK